MIHETEELTEALKGRTIERVENVSGFGIHIEFEDGTTFDANACCCLEETQISR